MTKYIIDGEVASHEKALELDVGDVYDVTYWPDDETGGTVVEITTMSGYHKSLAL